MLQDLEILLLTMDKICQEKTFHLTLVELKVKARISLMEWMKNLLLFLKKLAKVELDLGTKRLLRIVQLFKMQLHSVVLKVQESNRILQLVQIEKDRDKRERKNQCIHFSLQDITKVYQLDNRINKQWLMFLLGQLISQ